MGQDNGEALAHVGVRLNAQLGDGFWTLVSRLIVEYAALVKWPNFMRALAEVVF